MGISSLEIILIFETISGHHFFIDDLAVFWYVEYISM